MYLSLALNETVSEADILFFSLSKEINLSVELVNGSAARRGTIVKSGQQGFLARPTKDYLRIDSETGAVLDGDTIHIRGVFDMPLWGIAYIDVTERYQSIIGGPKVDLVSDVGLVLADGENVYLLHDYAEVDEKRAGSSARLSSLRKELVGKPDSEIDEEMGNFHMERDLLLRHMINGCTVAWKIPQDIVLGVRNSELRNFLKALEPATIQESAEKSVTTNERNTLLILIAALCSKAGIDTKARGAASQLAAIANTEVGIALDEGTVLSKLKQISDALESRRK